MPEGHTLHRLAREHARLFAGQQVAVTSPQGRFGGAGTVDGAVLVGTDAHGKHLFHRYEGGRVVHVHLGLFGRFYRHEVPPPEPRDTVRMRIVGAEAAVDLTGPNTCELIDPGEMDTVVAGLGADPLRDDADVDRAWAALERRRAAIGQVLLDQAVIAGVGNVYRAEVLHVHGIHPAIPAPEIDRDTFESMWRTLRAWMRRGVERGEIVTVEGDVPRDAEREQRVHVYRREVCRSCGAPVRRFEVGQRPAYACETCQPP